jgi:HAD superfamily hydrolase (TIGR01509 family)|tara:strand:+ start:805 stop:1713 length:909 start_codon:yes stop_codon:yes gene_type:complete
MAMTAMTTSTRVERGARTTTAKKTTKTTRRATTTRANAGSNTKNARFALLFDCDGVIVETEELHRLAYNGAFEAFDLKIDGERVEWVVKYYDVLQNTVGGGKPKMRWHFNEDKKAWPTSTMFAEAPSSDADRDALIDALQDKKTEIYKKIVEEVAVARPGVLALMDEAIADPSIAVGICSAATKAGFEKVVNSVVGVERLSKLDVLMAGDDVTRKKPDPLIYNLARDKVGLPASKCLVVEDSIVGLRAAVGADMACLITPCGSNIGADFMGEGASKVVNDLGAVKLAMLFPEGAETPAFDGL